MKVRRRRNIKIRQDDGFGGLIYVPYRNDFFAANENVFKYVKALFHEDNFLEFDEVPETLAPTYRALAKLGICETNDPETLESPYSGPSFLGNFDEIPSVQKPLVVNCFSTSYCPLSCIYCHADDLMKAYRADENELDEEKSQTNINNVISTAIMIPAMVAVITGGDPLFKPKRTIKLIEGLSKQKALVLDTSGYGNIDELLPSLKQYDVHVRISLDSFSQRNDMWRKVNPRYRRLSDTFSPKENAIRTIEKCIDAGLGVTVQTVVFSQNENLQELKDLRDDLIQRQVKNWVLHLVVRGGLARKWQDNFEKNKLSRGGVMPSDVVRRNLWKLMESTIKEGKDIDIRCTDNDSSPNSVLLINSEGDLFTEGSAKNGKVKLYDVKENQPYEFRAMWAFIDIMGHARRYLNWNKWYYDRQNLNEICYPVPLPKTEDFINLRLGLLKIERKYKVTNVDSLRSQLLQNGFVLSTVVNQLDEYYDTQKSNLKTFDYVLRVRKEKNRDAIESLKIEVLGTRFYAEKGEYVNFELSFPTSNEQDLIYSLKRMDLELIWFFEKKREIYVKEGTNLVVSVDEIPEIGFFFELNGPTNQISGLENSLLFSLGERETKNYRDIYIDYKNNQGLTAEGIKGPTFNEH